MNAAAWLQQLPAAHRWPQVLLARAPQIATWVLALAIAVQAAFIVTNLASIDSEPVADVPPPPPSAQQRFNVAAVANSHLFGEAQTQPTTADAENAPQTSMPLVLTGIIAADDPRNGLAIIGESAPTARVKAVNDSLPGGAKLYEVHADLVLIDRSGQIEKLVLPRQYAGTVSGPPPPPPPVAAAPAENPAIERMRQLVNEEPSVISDVMRQQPVFAQGKQRGYRVYPGRNRQAFMRLGLRPGDLVTAINGTPLDDPARGVEVFNTLGSASEARLTVMRNGRQQELTLNLGQLASEADQLLGTPGVPVEPRADAPDATTEE